jgi:16S rRNA U1498 N3-methylase RsmE
VQLFDGRGALATATVVQASRHQATLRVLSSSGQVSANNDHQHQHEEHASQDEEEEEEELGRTAAAAASETEGRVVVGRGHEEARRLTVAVAMPKGSRGDWVVEKLTEVGTHRVQPLLATKSILVPGDGRLQRWRQMARTHPGLQSHHPPTTLANVGV